MLFCSGISDNPGVSITLVIVLFLASAGIIYLLLRGIRKERARKMELTDEKENLNFDGMKRFIARVITNANKRTTFYLCRIDFNDFDSLRKSLGDTQYTNILRSISAAIIKTIPYPVRICSLDSGGLLIYIKPYMAFDPTKTCEILISTVSKEYHLANDMTVEINCNVGLLAYPEAGGNVEELIKNLDMCMIVSKRSGMDKYIIYSSQISNAETQEYQMYTEIKEAMKANEFGIHYQPVVNAENMEVIMGEGLIRWKHKTMGLLPPNKFLYIMEKTGDINWVGYWCFERIARQGQTWQANYEQRFELSMNISERQLLNSSFGEEIRRIERKIRSVAGSFVFEISNLNLYFTSDVAKYNVDSLKDMGFKIAFDGYDANYNTQLEQLPLDYIKINSSFWRKAADSQIYLNLLKMLVDYSNASGVKIIAYGVEDVTDIEKLKALGILYMQGYAFSKPTESSEFISEVLLTPWSADIAQGQAYTVQTEQPVDIDVMATLKAQNDAIGEPDKSPEQADEKKSEKKPDKPDKPNKKKADAKPVKEKPVPAEPKPAEEPAPATEAPTDKE